MKRVTLKDIARELGVDLSTVSKALRGNPAVSARTRERVRAKAEEMGYRPDPMLASLAAYRDQRRGGGYRATLAWVCNHPASAEMGIHAGYDDYLAGARESAERQGFALDVFHNGKGPGEIGGLLRVLRARGIPGLVLAPQVRPGVELNEDFAGLSVVSIGFTLKSPRLHVVTNDHFGTMLALLERLASMGCRRPACLLNEMDNHRMGHRMVAALETLGRERKIPMLVRRQVRRGEFLNWMKKNPRVDALITREPRVVRWLGLLGREIPVFSYALDHGEGPGMGMYHNNRAIGVAAVEMVAAMVQRGEQGVPALPRRLMLESRWVDHPAGVTWPARSPGSA